MISRTLSLIPIAAVLIFDQVSKLWIIHSVMAPPRSIEINSFLNIVMVWNTGISFGMFNEGVSVWVMAALAGIIILVLMIWFFRSDRIRQRIALGLIIGGALGNLIDRLYYGAVADFLDFHFNDWHWPAFNIADSGITIGAILFIVDGLLFGQKQSPKVATGKRNED